jgi:hypothetical protein
MRRERKDNDVKTKKKLQARKDQAPEKRQTSSPKGPLVRISSHFLRGSRGSAARVRMRRNAFGGLHKAIIMRSETALFRIYSGKFALFRFTVGGGPFGEPDLLVKRTNVARMVQKQCGKLQIVRLCPRLPALSAFARLFVGASEVQSFRFKVQSWESAGIIFTGKEAENE